MPRSRRAPGSIQKRGNSFWIRLCVGGERYIFSVKTKHRRVAEDAARAKFDELEKRLARRQAGLPTDILMSDLIEHFRTTYLPTRRAGTVRSYEDSLKFIEEYFIDKQRDPLVASVRVSHITAYLDWRRVHRAKGKGPGTKDRPLSGRTCAKDRAVISKMFSLAEVKEWCTGNPVRATSVPKGDTRKYILLTDDQFEALLVACPDKMTRHYVLVMGETGARCESEVLWLQWDDIDLDGGFLKIASGRGGHETKSGEPRWIPMTHRLTQATREYFSEYRFVQYGGTATPWMFHHGLTRRHHTAGQRITSLRRGVMDAAKKAKLPEGWVQHDLRHRRVTTWLGEGKPVALVKEVLGHSDIATTMMYMHLTREHLRGLVETPTREQLKAGLA